MLHKNTVHYRIRKAEADTFLAAISRYRATYFSAVPAIYARLADAEISAPPWRAMAGVCRTGHIRRAAAWQARGSQGGRAGTFVAGRRIGDGPPRAVAGVKHQGQPRGEEERPGDRDDERGKARSCHVSSS